MIGEEFFQGLESRGQGQDQGLHNCPRGSRGRRLVLEDSNTDYKELYCENLWAPPAPARSPLLHMAGNGRAPWVEEQQTKSWPNCTDHHEIAHKND